MAGRKDPGVQLVKDGLGADREDDVGVADGFGGRILAPHAGDAEMEPVIRRQRALAHERRIDWNIELFGERLQLLVSAADAYAVYFFKPEYGRYGWAGADYTVHSRGELRALEQRLTYANIHAVRAGMTRDDVRRLLGPPYEISRLPRQQREVWEYPWLHAAREGRVLFAQFADDGVVREVIERHDYERDPENDSRR